MRPVGTRTIKTKRLVLRRIEASDAPELVQIRSLTMSAAEAERQIINLVQESHMPFGFHWVITREGRIIGRVKAWDVDPYNGHLQLGYDIGQDYRNQGYMTEAVRAVISYLMNEAETHRIMCSVRTGNTASCRVCEKSGMHLEGMLRQHYARQDGGYDDVNIYAILRNEA